MFTKLEREKYNEDRERACKRLNITKNQYNWLRRRGNELHKLYEDYCNGINEAQEDYEDYEDYEDRTTRLEDEVREYLLSQKLYKKNKKVYYVYFQTDPRGATIYLDTKAIPENDYIQAVCIY